MIAKLRGLLDSLGEDHAVVDVGGVGYLAYCSARTLSRLPAPGEPVELHIETHVREDHIHLYGFREAAERDWFRLLTSVQGVGSKGALAILTVLPPDLLVQAIAAQDRAALARAQGVGPKLAARILNELRDKAGAIALGAAARGGAAASTPPAAVGAAGAADVPADVAGEAASALVNLGYGRTEALGVVARAARKLGEGADVAALIRQSLADLAPKGG